MLMRCFYLFVWVIVAGLWAGCTSAVGRVAPVQAAHSTARLISSEAGVQPGQTFDVGVHLDLEKGWHVYWRNPGDSGLPLSLDWSLPEGTRIGPVSYPVPHKIHVGPFVNYGHEGRPTFLIPITVPSNISVGTEFVATVVARWLACLDVCVPEAATLSLALPVVATPAAQDPVWGEQMRQARAQTPKPLRDKDGNILQGISFSYAGQPTIFIPDTGLLDGATLTYFPYEQGLIAPTLPVRQAYSAQEGRILSFAPGDAFDATAPAALSGVVTFKRDGHLVGIEVIAPLGVPSQSARRLASMADIEKAPQQQRNKTTSVIRLFLLALIGGLVLNVMPCVFPVIFMKAVNLSLAVCEGRVWVKIHGLLYTSGVLVSFLVIALILLALRTGGNEIGWGFHLQSPIALAIYTLIIFLAGLSFFGLFEIGTTLQGAGGRLARYQGALAAFMTGLLAVAVAAPCIGPFLGVAMGIAFGQSALVSIGFFMMMGLGLALPYLLLSILPALAAYLPRPGAWMVRVKELLAFSMFATCIWLIWVMVQQVGADGLLYMLVALLLSAMAAWQFGLSQKNSRNWMYRLCAVFFLVGVTWSIVQIYTLVSKPAQQHADAEPYNETRLVALRSASTPVFVEFTAAWCLTCQVNKRLVLDTPRVRAAFATHGVVLMVADWTAQDPIITRALEAQGRIGVPLYLFYPADAAEPVILPQLLTANHILKIIR